MSRQSFTPGPWLCCDGPEHYEHRIYVDATETTGTAICDVVSTNDARLIAAAPALLDRHERDMAELELLAKAIGAGDPMCELVIRVTDMLVAKRAAIAKARGDA